MRSAARHEGTVDLTQMKKFSMPNEIDFSSPPRELFNDSESAPDDKNTKKQSDRLLLDDSVKLSDVEELKDV